MRRLHWSWLSAWIVQLIESATAGALIALSHALGGWESTVIAYIGMALFGAVSSYRAVRRGLNNYLGWILPPVCMYVAHLLIWTYVPAPGPVLVCALCSVVGAAAGEVRNREGKQSKRKKGFV